LDIALSAAGHLKRMSPPMEFLKKYADAAGVSQDDIKAEIFGVFHPRHSLLVPRCFRAGTLQPTPNFGATIRGCADKALCANECV
jgi:hypothetical protein